MKKSKSFFKTCITALGLMHCMNEYINSTFISHSIHKSGGKFYHWKHGDIYYTVSDHDSLKSPILLIHDLTVFSSEYEWHSIIKELSKSYTVFTLDLIGCGRSDKPQLTYTNYFYVQMINDFITDVIGLPTKVVATGLSSSFVLMANFMNKNLFSEIVIVNPKSLTLLKKAPDTSSKVLKKLLNLPIVGKTVYYMAVNKQNTEYYLTEKCFCNPFHLTQSITKAYYDAAHTCSGKGKMLLASVDGFYINIDITKALKHAGKNITLILGDHNENITDIENSYTRLNPEISTKIIKNTKLLPQLEDPDTFLMFIK